MKNQVTCYYFLIKTLISGILLTMFMLLSLSVTALESDSVNSGMAEVPSDQSQNNETSMEIAWVDVRSWLEYQFDHIDGDPRVAHTDIVAGVSRLYPDKNTPIRLYCASGGRAGSAANDLIAAGYTDVKNLGGIADVRAMRAKNINK